MQLAFDHLVHFINRPPSEAVDKMKQHGFHAVQGGRHEHWGTYNSLSYLGLSYIEFLAIENPLVAKQSENPLIQQIVRNLPNGEGLGQIALRTQEIGHLADHLRKQGLVVTGPLPGSRMRSDGSVIEWKMLFIESEQATCPLPFFIQWDQPTEGRLRDLTTRGIIAEHSNGATGIEYVAYAVNDLASTVNQWQEWFGFEADERFFHPDMQADCQLLQCLGGNLLFCSPQGRSIANDTLQSRGELPFLLKLSGLREGEPIDMFGSKYLL